MCVCISKDMKGLYFPIYIYYANNIVQIVTMEKYLGIFIADDNYICLIPFSPASSGLPGG